MTPGIAVVIPCLDEADNLRHLLDALRRQVAPGDQLIVADGGSADGSAELARQLADVACRGRAGRARQMNAGARMARAGLLLFLHADSRVPDDFLPRLRAASGGAGFVWGFCPLRLSGRAPLLRIIERAINLRSRLSQMATGDQALLVRRDTFARLGGFADLELMEDLAMSRSLRRLSRPLILPATITTSSRRWEQRGIIATVLLMWWLRFLYACGVAPALLARWYR